MNTPGLINFFASNGYLIDQAALSYVKAHDHKELLELFKEYNPELIVIDLPSTPIFADRLTVIIKYNYFIPNIFWNLFSHDT
jgi:hypothetical protein